MIDAAAFLAVSLALAALVLALSRVLLGRGASRARRIARGTFCVLASVAVTGFGSWKFSNARTVQLFGGIVPRVETADSVVALTFDDGPAPRPTEQILAILREHGVTATFFLNGQSIREHLPAARSIVQQGHEVGNHSYTHRMMIGVPLHRIRGEIDRTDEEIRRAGFRGGIHFRSPYGKKYAALPYHLARTDRLNIFWDVEPETDPSIGRDAGRIRAHVVENASPGSIILLHVMSRSRSESLEAVPGIIQDLQARGYRFVTVSELLRRRPSG